VARAAAAEAAKAWAPATPVRLLAAVAAAMAPGAASWSALDQVPMVNSSEKLEELVPDVPKMVATAPDVVFTAQTEMAT